MPRAARHRTPSAVVETAIVAAASALLEEGGPDAVTIRALAERAGVSPASVYNRFAEGKQGVLEELFEDGFRRLGAMFADLPRDDAVVAVREAGRGYRRLALDRPHTYGLMFDRAVAGFEPSDDGMIIAAQAFERLVALVQWAMSQRSGPESSATPTEVAQQMWSACHGAVSLELRELGFVEDRTLAFEQLLDTISVGVGLETPQGPPRRQRSGPRGVGRSGSTD